MHCFVGIYNAQRIVILHHSLLFVASSVDTQFELNIEGLVIVKPKINTSTLFRTEIR